LNPEDVDFLDTKNNLGFEVKFYDKQKSASEKDRMYQQLRRYVLSAKFDVVFLFIYDTKPGINERYFDREALDKNLVEDLEVDKRVVVIEYKPSNLR